MSEPTPIQTPEAEEVLRFLVRIKSLGTGERFPEAYNALALATRGMSAGVTITVLTFLLKGVLRASPSCLAEVVVELLTLAPGAAEKMAAALKVVNDAEEGPPGPVPGLPRRRPPPRDGAVPTRGHLLRRGRP